MRRRSDGDRRVSERCTGTHLPRNPVHYGPIVRKIRYGAFFGPHCTKSRTLRTIRTYFVTMANSHETLQGGPRGSSPTGRCSHPSFPRQLPRRPARRPRKTLSVWPRPPLTPLSQVPPVPIPPSTSRALASVRARPRAMRARPRAVRARSRAVRA